MNNEEKITFLTEDGENVDFYVLEETRINNINYLLVTDEEEGNDGECYILKDTSKPEEAEASYEFVDNDEEIEYLFKIFSELLGDADVDIEL